MSRRHVRPALVATGLVALLGLPLAPGASAAPGAPACGVSVLTRTDTGGQTELLVAAPELLSQIALPAEAFSLRQGRTAAPLTVRPLTDAEKTLTVVLASSATTTPASYQAARGAALELLVGLPQGTSTGVVTTGQAQPLSPVSADLSRSSRSLRTARPGTALTSDAAVRLAARGLAPGSHVVLFSDAAEGAGATTPSTLRQELAQRQIVLDRVQYRAPGQAAPADTAAGEGRSPCVSADDQAVRQVDHVIAEFRGQYWLRTTLRDATAAQLSVRAAGTTSSVTIPASTTAGAVLADPYRARGPGRQTVERYAAAAILATAGLLLVAVARRRRPADTPPSVVPYSGDHRVHEAAAQGQGRVGV